MLIHVDATRIMTKRKKRKNHFRIVRKVLIELPLPAELREGDAKRFTGDLNDSGVRSVHS